MLLIIISIITIIIMFKLTLVFLKILGKLIGATISIIGYLLLGGILFIVSIPVVIISVMVISGIIAIIFGCARR